MARNGTGGGGSATIAVSRQQVGSSASEHPADSVICAPSDPAKENLIPVLPEVAEYCPRDRIRDAMEGVLLPALGASSSQVIPLPVLFRRSDGGHYWLAYASNVINCLVAKGRAVMPDTHGPMVATTDEFRKEINSLPDAIATVRFIDAWALHEAQGEVHCGSNVRRAPVRGVDWWEAWPTEWDRGEP
jgi:hypothetical protein